MKDGDCEGGDLLKALSRVLTGQSKPLLPHPQRAPPEPETSVQIRLYDICGGVILSTALYLVNK